MTYLETATQIIKDSIKSAIFIDENALPFYETPSEKEVLEERLSRELYSNFKEDGITCDIHRFTKGDELNSVIVHNLFDRRDLILLDWKLDKNDGELLSLKLLEEIIKKDHIHFCAIYTKETDANLDDIYWNILSYFSGSDSAFYSDIKLDLTDLEEELTPLISQIKYHSENRFNKNLRKERGLFLAKHKEIVKRSMEATRETDKLCALIKAGIAFGNQYTSERELPCPSMISPSNKTITINNTIITILNKDANRPDVLIENFSNQVSESDYSFLQLLGLEAHHIFGKKAAFIDTEMLAISKEAFLYHRNQKKEDNFGGFIKDILIEKARLNFRDEELLLLNDDLLDNMITTNGIGAISDKELKAMNIFYNSTKLEGNRKLNFGDVFKIGDKYLICITALCDCLTPKKNKFYFAEGTKMKAQDAFGLGDGAFISYLNQLEIVQWTDINQDKSKAHFMPVYIKPIQFTVPQNIIKDNKLTLVGLTEEAQIEPIEVEYLTTIKQNYTQRIANHAFSHPVRVGIDFVKKE
nr:response regulator receiver domain [uncultured Draconibacterium sp.]